jgi:hypothetical protein
MQGRRRRLLVSSGEVATDRVLDDAATRLGYRVFAKVRIADALEITRSGLSNEQFRYALSAHFDFVAADHDSLVARFAVEFDGPQHHTGTRTAARDALKDAICEALDLPLLRIDGAFLKRVDHFTILGYLIEVNALAEAFYEQQQKGYIPWDEDFDYWSVISTENGRLVQPFDLAAPAKRLIATMHARGEIQDWTFSHATNFFPDPETNRHVAYVWVKARDNEWIIGSGAIRAFNFPGIGAWDIAEQLAARDLHQRLLRHRAGEDVAASDRDLDELVRLTEGWQYGGIVRQGGEPVPRHVVMPGG